MPNKKDKTTEEKTEFLNTLEKYEKVLRIFDTKAQALSQKKSIEQHSSQTDQKTNKVPDSGERSSPHPQTKFQVRSLEVSSTELLFHELSGHIRKRPSPNESSTKKTQPKPSKPK